MLIAFDIDGTLANADHRLHHWEAKPKRWDEFKAEIINDTVIEPVAYLFREYRKYHDVIIITARSEDSRILTEQWLYDNDLGGYDNLYMRPDGDYRCDSIVKQELLEDVINDFGKKPDAVFEDRPRVVSMWKKLGVFVFAVYQQEDDF